MKGDSKKFAKLINEVPGSTPKSQDLELELELELYYISQKKITKWSLPANSIS